MTIDEAIERYTHNAEYERTHGSLQGCLEFRQLAEWLRDYKRLLEQQPCAEAISKPDHDVEVLKAFLFGGLAFEFAKKYDEMGMIKAMSAEPKTGHWIEDEYEMEVRCSVCGEENDECSKYCPKCGALMIEPQAENEEKIWQI